MLFKKFDVKLLGLLGVTALCASAIAGPPAAKPVATGHAQPVKSDLSKARNRLIGMSDKFMQNKGQWDSRAAYGAASPGLNVWLEKRGIDFDYFARSGSGKRAKRVGDVVRLDFLGASPSFDYVPLNAVGDHIDFLIGAHPVKGITSFRSVVAKNVYPGVDMRAYFDNGKPRYDLVASASSDPSKIKLHFSGAKSVAAQNDRIVLQTSLGKAIHSDLVAYQNVSGKQHRVAAQFVTVGKNVVGLKLGAYDHHLPLVIDPVVYGTYYGGDDGFDEVRSVVEDADGGTFMAGYTQSIYFPAIYGPYGFNLIGQQNAFLSKLQGDAYNHEYAAFIGGSAIDAGIAVKLDQYNQVWLAGTTESSDFPGNTRPNLEWLVGASGTQSSFLLSYSAEVTTPIPANATAAQVQAALNALPGLSGAFTVLSNGTALNAGGTYEIVVSGQHGALLQQDNGNSPYAIEYAPPLGFALAFQRSASTVLAPLPQALIFGNPSGAYSQNPTYLPAPPANLEFDTFDVLNNTSLQSNAPVELLFSGNTSSDISDLGLTVPIDGNGNAVASGWIAEYNYTDAGGFSGSPDWSTLVALNPNALDHNGNPDYQSGDHIVGRGAIYDPFGNIDTAGTIYYHHNEETDPNAVNGAQVPIFQTTSGVWTNGTNDGRLVKFNDIYIRQYQPSAGGAGGYNLAWGGFLGGHANDEAGGYDLDQTLNQIPTGPAIAADVTGNVYVTGISRSYDFPRTHNAFYQDFTDNPDVFVTKISYDGSQILSSTGLNFAFDFNSWFGPAGIAVDSRGQAFITGNIHPSEEFPEDDGNAPGNPDTPTKTHMSTITPNPLVGTPPAPLYECFQRLLPKTPAPPQIGTSQDWLIVLNDTSSDLVFDTYLGDILDNRAYAPYVDAFGDGWVFGWVDSFREYVLFSSTGTPTFYTDAGAAFPQVTQPKPTDPVWENEITNLAFKSYPDSAGQVTFENIAYGLLGLFAPSDGVQPANWFSVNAKDGYVIRLRLGLPALAGLTFNPAVIPGGNGASTTGTITLSNPAAASGATVNVSVVSGSAVSFSATSSVTSSTVQIAGGATTGTFTLYSQAVSANTENLVTANLDGSIETAGVTVVPWLTNLQLSPGTLVGGNTINGTISIAAPAPQSGIAVTLATNDPTDVQLSNTTVAIPAGQTSANFTVNTGGVGSNTSANITATLLSYSLDQGVTLTPAGLSGLAFQPTHVSAGSSTTGTVSLNGQAPNDAADTQSVAVVIDSNDDAELNAVGGQTFPMTVMIANGQSTGTFQVTTPIAPQVAQVSFTATMAADQSPDQNPSGTAAATLFIDSYSLTGFTVDQNEIPSGGTATGTITIATPAPTGGVVVDVASSVPGVVTVPTSVTIPAAAASVTFPIQGNYDAANTSTIVSVSRNGQSLTQPITVDALPFTIQLTPSDLLGGTMATGAITLGAPAPAGGITLTVSADLSNLIDFGGGFGAGTTVMIPAGQTTTVDVNMNPIPSFTMNTGTVTSTTSVNISASWTDSLTPPNTEIQSQALTLEPVGLTGITFTPDLVRGGETTSCVVTLSGPAPAGGATINFSHSLPGLLIGPSSVTIPAGSTVSVPITFMAAYVPRSLIDTVTATYANGSGSVSTEVVVER